MTYKKIAFSSVLLVLIIIIIVAFLCFIAFSSTFGYSESKKTFTESEEGITVIIDAGHGGEDPGACANGLEEKELNLIIAKKLGEYLSLTDVNVIYTRTTDTLLGNGELGNKKTADLKARLNLAETTDNCIFISIHMNKFAQSDASGLQTFYASSVPQSQTLALAIQNACKSIDPSNKRTVKPDSGNIYILEHTTKVAVLVECGFLSNNKDATNLSTDEYQNKLAFSIYCGIIKFLEGR